MTKKTITATLAVMTALSSFSFAAQTAVQVKTPEKTMIRTMSAEDKKLYDQIYSKYEDKFNKIEVGLLENRQESQKLLRQEKIDWKKVENLTKKKADLRAQKELLGYQLRAELKENNLKTAPVHRRNHHRGGSPAFNKGCNSL
jgi:formyltetrahydrofolate hydrolase